MFFIRLGKVHSEKTTLPNEKNISPVVYYRIKRARVCVCVYVCVRVCVYVSHEETKLRDYTCLFSNIYYQPFSFDQTRALHTHHI